MKKLILSKIFIMGLFSMSNVRPDLAVRVFSLFWRKSPKFILFSIYTGYQIGKMDTIRNANAKAKEEVDDKGSQASEQTPPPDKGFNVFCQNSSLLYEKLNAELRKTYATLLTTFPFISRILP